MSSEDIDLENGRIEIMEPNFDLQKRLGRSAGQIMSPSVFDNAQKALLAAIPPLDHEVERLLSELQQAVLRRDANARDVIWNNAHEIRGLAGTAGKISLGKAADLLCSYLNGSDKDFEADAEVLSTIAIVAVRAVKEGADEDSMIKVLLRDGERAVIVQRAREGRGPAD
jgi:hypothetical protein